LGLSFEAGEGPRFSRPLRDEQAVNNLRPADLNQLKYVFDAVSEIRKALTQNGQQRVPLIGFSGSPWTLACYMIEGSGSSDFKNTKEMLYQRPDLMKKVLDTNIQSVADYLTAQVDAGAQALMIFDTWGGLLPDGWYQKTSLASMKAVIDLLPRQKDGQRIPILVFTKGGGIWLEDIAHSGADVIGLDWTASVAKSRKPILTRWPYFQAPIKLVQKLREFWMNWRQPPLWLKTFIHWMAMSLIWAMEYRSSQTQSMLLP
jgi:uroporphyrinogen decarboxylase